MQTFNGKKQAEILTSTIKTHLTDGAEGKSSINQDLLLIIQIGKDQSSQKYVKMKQTLCEDLDIPCDALQIDETLEFSEISNIIKSLFSDNIYSGGIIQLPLPDSFSKKEKNSILDLIPQEKDLDLLSTMSKKAYYSGDFTRLSPVVRALNNFIKSIEIENKHKTAVVLGGGELIGKPISYFLRQQDFTVTVMDEVSVIEENFADFNQNFQNDQHSKNNIILKSELYTSGAPINCNLLVLGAGKPALVKGEDISVNCNVVDFGSTVVNGKSVGDLDYDSKLEHLGLVSKSPGGMGPLVVRYLIMNFLGI